MAKITRFQYYDITGSFSKSNIVLLKYPFLYSLTRQGKLYRLNVISHISELIASIDVSDLFNVVSGKISISFGCLSVNTDKMYFYAYGKTSSTTLTIYLCELDLSTFECNTVYVVNTSPSKSFYYGSVTYWGKVIGQDDSIYVYSYFSQLHKTSSDGAVIDTVGYFVDDYNYLTRSKTSLIQQSASASYIRYQLARGIPYITNESHLQLLYGYVSSTGTYTTKTGFTDYREPTTITTLNGGKYNKVGLFELSGKYYAIGGSIADEVNTDIIQININSLASVKIGESPNTSTDQPAIVSTPSSAYIVFSNTLMGVAELVEYNIDYTFKDNDGNTLAELTDKLPVQAVNVSSSGNDVTVTLTYIDSTTDTVFYTLPPKENVQFLGLSDTPNSKRAMLVEGDNSISIYNNITFYPVYIRYVVPSTTFNIELYQNSAEVNRVDKSNYLLGVGTLSGALREECSMLTPSIVYQSESVPIFNYVYIPIFNRYYFVTSLSSVSKNVWRMELNCDVLMTYKNEILLLSGVVGRQENDFNEFLVDDKLPAQKDATIEFLNPLSTTLNPFNTQKGFNDYIYVLTVVG